MKMPSQCPVCSGVMSNEYSGKHQQHFVKQCTKKVTHSVVFKADTSDHDKVYFFSIAIAPGVKAFWFPDEKYILLDSLRKSMRLPFFDPDFSNYQKLINKLKLYVTFS